MCEWQHVWHAKKTRIMLWSVHIYTMQSTWETYMHVDGKGDTELRRQTTPRNAVQMLFFKVNLTWELV